MRSFRPPIFGLTTLFLLATFFCRPAPAEVAIEDRDPSTFKVGGSEPFESEVIDGRDGRKALRVDVAKVGEDSWGVVYHSPNNTLPIRKDDTLVFEVTARVTGKHGDRGQLRIATESSVPDKDGYAGDQILPGKDLRTYRGSLLAPGDFDPGEYRLAIHLAAQPQEVELYAASLEVHPSGTPASDLRLDGPTWEGRESDAAWRERAERRIDELRKQDLAVTVVDPDGRPISGATTSVTLKRHDWRFGTFVGNKLLEDNDDGRRYREEVLRRFNFLTLPAYLADWGWRNPWNRQKYLELADWALENDLPARGHLLVYPGWTATPGEWFEIPKDELRRNMEAHIPRAVRAFRVRGVTEWDVTNELRMNRQFMEEIGGLEVAAEWFKIARRLLPDDRPGQSDLYINDTFILSNGGETEKEQSAYESHIKMLIDKDAPLGGIGLQGHFGSQLTPPERLIEILDRFAAFDLPIMITEFDIDIEDEQARADYLRDFYTTCFSHPAVKGIIRWGFWEGEMWKPRGHSMTNDWQPNAMADMHDHLLNNVWGGTVDATTDDEGNSRHRLFRGTHEVSVKVGDYTYRRDVTVTDQPVRHVVIVPGK